MSGYLTSFPSSITRHMSDIDIQSLVLVRVFESLADEDLIEENRVDMHFNEEYHRMHKKINGVTSHGCGCDYCKALNKYSILVLRAHRIGKMIDDRWYGRYWDMQLQMQELAKLKIEVKEARTEKNRLKEEIALSRLYN